MQNTINTNEWINYIEESISSEYFKLYEQKHFSNIQKVGTGRLGEVYRASWKNSQYFALKSFFNLDDVTAKEIVHEENFNSLTWNVKYNFAYQLACAVSCLHNEGIVHCDLHSGNVLVHQNIIKLSDFGLSKRIESSSNTQSKLFGIIPYVDPKRFSKQYDIDLALEISQGLREELIPDTPEDYVNIYTECWNGEPDKRPTINQIVEVLKAIMTKTNIITENYQTELILHSTSTEGLNFIPTNIDTLLNIDNSLHGEMIQNFDKMDIREIVPRSLNEKNLNKTVNDTVNYIFKIINKGKESTRIETSENNKEAFDLFINASEQGHILAQFYVGLCYQSGCGTVKDENLAFKYYEKIANMGYASGLLKIGYFYDHGIGTIIDKQKAIELYQQAANLGNSVAQYNLALTYYNGDGVDKDYEKAFELCYKAANSENSDAQYNLALMYYNGEGTEKDYEKAFELYYKVANLGDSDAQYNLGIMYEYGKGIDKDINQAIYCTTRRNAPG
ncbi:kinase-like domain-containing protein [Rhizophagus irregularis DAOM 181602=DAOM 197198]|nr:kinase-like domain-containing protein [Rhizophagus irregularis DAOM 181602=DAOM 197198]